MFSPQDNLLTFQYVNASQRPEEWKCSDRNGKKDSNIASGEPIDILRAIYKPETDQASPMERHKNMECTNAKQLEAGRTEEVKCGENHDNFKDEFVYMRSEFKDMLHGNAENNTAVKYPIDL